MRRLSTLLVVLGFAIGSISMVGCDKGDATNTDGGSATETPAASNTDSDAPATSNLTEVSFEVTGMS